MCSRIPTPISSARSRSICTPCALPRANCGASRPRQRLPSMSTSGMTTSNLPDAPVFAEPWQAQAFALAVRLSEQGYFTWTEWAAALAAELKAAEPDDGSHYYDHWLAALERLVAAKGLTHTAALDARKKAWARGYRAGPH